MIEDLKTHFEAKNNLAQKEISEDCPLLALKFQEKNKEGVLLITKSQNNAPRWQVFNADHGEPILVGVAGRQLDFIKFCDWLRKCLDNFINLYGPRNINTPYLLKQITQYLDEIYTTESLALRVELIFFSSLGGYLKMFRIKHDGDYHPTPHYAVIGGQKKIAGTETSLRKSALQELTRAYFKKIPSSKDAKTLGKKILNLAHAKGKLQFARINFIKNPQKTR